MVFNGLFQRFVEASPACVMHRALMENIFAPEKLDAVFQRAAKVQYQRELLFSTVVELTSQVVCRLSKSTRMAYLAQRERITVSLQAIYDKLGHIELGTSEALVRYTSRQASEIQSVYGGMMVALPPIAWKSFQTLSPAELAKQLLQWARAADLSRYQKQSRDPKPPKQKLPSAQARHVATSRLLEEQRLRKQRKRKTTSRSRP